MVTSFAPNHWPSPVPPDQKSLADALQEEVYSTELEIETVRQKVEKAQEQAEKKLVLLFRRKFALERSIAREKEQGAGFSKVNHGADETMSVQVRP